MHTLDSMIKLGGVIGSIRDLSNYYDLPRKEIVIGLDMMSSISFIFGKHRKKIDSMAIESDIDIYIYRRVLGSLETLCRVFEKDYNTVYHLIVNKGFTIHSAMKRKRSKVKPVEHYNVNGVIGDLTFVCKELDINRNKVYAKMVNGMTIIEAIESVRSIGNNIDVDGVIKSLHAHSIDRSMNYNTVIKRVRNGMTPEEALKTPLYNGRYNIDGERLTIRDVSKRNGISYIDLIKNMKNGMSITNATSKVILNTKIFKINGIENNITGHSKSRGMIPSTVIDRLKDGELLSSIFNRDSELMEVII